MHAHNHREIRIATIAHARDDDVLLTARQVCAKLGGISCMTLWRWLGSDTVRFPQPTARINNRRFWSVGVIRRWLAERSSEGVAA
jgi:predicted DNA-binding transcriptional regulator AlpA